MSVTDYKSTGCLSAKSGNMGKYIIRALVRYMTVHDKAL